MNDSAQARKRIRLIALLVMSFLGSPMAYLMSTTAETSVVIGSQRQSQSRLSQKAVKRASTQKPRIDYSRFSHQTHVTLQKLSCDSCHKFPTKNWKDVRKGDSAFPDVAEFPEHASCLDCHRSQFFARERPAPAICTNCHLNVTPRNTARYLFPSLEDVSDSSATKRTLATEFGINFPHDKHLDVVSFKSPDLKLPDFGLVRVTWQEKAAPTASVEPKSCPVCHQTYLPQGNSAEEYATPAPKNLGDNFWLKKGTFKTAPKSHTVCFSCHNADLGIAPAPNECNGCHKLAAAAPDLKTDFDPKLVETMAVTDKFVLTTWPRRISSGAFRHEGGEHPNISCTKCHDVQTMNTLTPKARRVPMSSCGGAEGCHVTATTDDGGILNYEIDQRKTNASFVCTKCHLSFGKDVVPKTHNEAIPTPSPQVKPSLN